MNNQAEQFESTATDIAAEVFLALKERYLNCVSRDGDGVTLAFENGKKFIIKVEEV